MYVGAGFRISLTLANFMHAAMAGWLVFAVLDKVLQSGYTECENSRTE